jgi:hypothetical protein
VWIYFLFINQIEQFFYGWTHKLEGYRCSLSVWSKEVIQKNTRIFFSWKNISRPFSSFNPIFSSFKIFEWLKTWWVHILRLYKISLNARILICFNLHITKHWTPLHQTSHIFLILLSNWVIFMVFETLGGGLNMFFELQKLKNNMWGFDLLSMFIHRPIYPNEI